jgi:hypothetical protein
VLKVVSLPKQGDGFLRPRDPKVTRSSAYSHC